MFDELFNEIFKGWNRPVKESNGWNQKKTDYGVLITANTLGIEQSDLVIGLKRGVLTLEGETQSEETGFNNTIKFSWNINKEIDIDKIEYQSKNGITYIHIYTKVPKEPKIKITSI